MEVSGFTVKHGRGDAISFLVPGQERDDDALEFYLKYKEDLFKDIPASFFGIYDKKNIERALKYKNVAGVREVESLDQIIELIRKHHKNVENIVFIGVLHESCFPAARLLLPS